MLLAVHLPRRTFVVLLAVGGLCIVMALLYGFWMAVRPHSIDVRYREGNTAWMQKVLPLEVTTDKDIIELRTIFSVTYPLITHWNIHTQGCVLDAHFNEVALTGLGECGNTTLSLDTLQAGKNELRLSLRAPHTFSFSPSPLDPVMAGLLVVAWLLAAAWLYAVHRYLHADGAGIILVATLLLGLIVRGWIAITHTVPGMPPEAMFLLSSSAMMAMAAIVFHKRAHHDALYEWVAGLLIAMLPLLAPHDVLTELLACTLTAIGMLWWERHFTHLWIGLLVLQTFAIFVEPAFLAVAVVLLVCLLRHKTISPKEQLLLFLVKCGVLITQILIRPPFIPSSGLVRTVFTTDILPQLIIAHRMLFLPLLILLFAAAADGAVQRARR